jgi:hypothetical protein
MPLPSPVLTLKTFAKNIPGFQNGKLTINVYYNESIQSAINKLNEYRTPSNKIINLYNSNFELLPKVAWQLKLKENTTLYIDNPSNPTKDNKDVFNKYKESSCLL